MQTLIFRFLSAMSLLLISSCQSDVQKSRDGLALDFQLPRLEDELSLSNGAAASVLSVALSISSESGYEEVQEISTSKTVSFTVPIDVPLRIKGNILAKAVADGSTKEQGCAGNSSNGFDVNSKFYFSSLNTSATVSSAQEFLTITYPPYVAATNRRVALTLLDGTKRVTQTEIFFADSVSHNPIINPCTGKPFSLKTDENGRAVGILPISENALELLVNKVTFRRVFSRTDALENIATLDLAKSKITTGAPGGDFLGTGTSDADKVTKNISPFYSHHDVSISDAEISVSTQGKISVAASSIKFPISCKLIGIDSKYRDCSTLEVKPGANAQNVGLSVQMKDADGYTKEIYSGNVVIPGLSKIADLSVLSLSPAMLSPVFSQGTTSYVATVPYSTSSVTLSTITAHAKSSISLRVNGGTSSLLYSQISAFPINLNVGTNSIQLLVTAENGTSTKTYSVAVTRAASTESSLSGLALTAGGLSPVFSPSTLSYAATVPWPVGFLSVIPTSLDATAVVTVGLQGGVSSPVLSGAQSEPISIAVGANILEIKVIAADGVTNQTYTVMVTRLPSSISDLASLSFSGGAITPSFSSATYFYSASVPHSETSVTLQAGVLEPSATLEMGLQGGTMTTVGSGATSPAMALTVGTNAIDVRVTAEDGVTVSTYTLVVTRAPSNNADLAALSISNAALSTVFSPAVTYYMAEASNSQNTLSVTAVTGHVSATLEVAINSGPYVSVTSGSASAPLSLTPGTNVVAIKVTAADAVTQKIYTVSASWFGNFPSGAVSYWSMENSIVDRVEGTGNHGNWQSSHSFSVGKIGTGVSLNSGNFINCGDFPNALPTGNADRSFAAWMYPTGSSTMTIVGWGADSGAALSEIGITDGNKLWFHGQGQDLESNNTLTRNTWTHVVVTIGSTTVRMFINGVQDSATRTVSLNTPLERCKIGRQPEYDGQHFSGKLDEIGIWSRALSPTEIVNLYNSGNGLAY